MRRVLVLICFAVATFVTAPADAGPFGHTVTGRWLGGGLIGTGSSVEHRHVILNIFNQVGRRFDGEATVFGVDCLITGMLSQSMHMSITGSCEDVSRLVIEGQATDTDDVGTIVPCTFEGRWILTRMGRSQSGDLVLLHDEGGPKHLIEGDWDGEAFDEDGNRAGRLTAQFTGDRSGTGTDGFLQFLSADDDNGSLFEVLLDLTHPADPGSPYGFALVGGGESGLLVMIGRFTPGGDDALPRIDGELTLLPSVQTASGSPNKLLYTGFQDGGDPPSPAARLDVRPLGLLKATTCGGPAQPSPPSATAIEAAEPGASRAR